MKHMVFLHCLGEVSMDDEAMRMHSYEPDSKYHSNLVLDREGSQRKIFQLVRVDKLRNDILPNLFNPLICWESFNLLGIPNKTNGG